MGREGPTERDPSERGEVEKFQGIPTRAVGQKNVPGIAQSLSVEEATILDQDAVETAVREVMKASVAPTMPAPAAEERAAPPPTGDGDSRNIAWIPPRYYLG